MIKELSNFMHSLDPGLKALGTKNKEGLHILLKIRAEDGRLFINDDALVQWGFTRKKDPQPVEIAFLKRCAFLQQRAWCVNTNKCLDLPTKAIHSCSPYCIALKKENLTGGEKYRQNSKSQVYERIGSYFDKAAALLDSETEKQHIQVFANALNTEEKFNHWLSLIPEYTEVKDAEYVIIYLDEPIEKYQQANEKYLADKLFNTNEYNRSLEGVIYGTSDFFNGYPTKKPFLTHQTAAFDIAGRISAREARDLYEFQEIIARNILPKPVPIFVYNDELIKASNILFKRDTEQTGNRIGYKEIIEDLNEKYQNQLENYYLLFYDRGTIKDFDFVSKFEYYLEKEPGQSWEILDWFDIGFNRSLQNVFQLETAVLQPALNNALITRTKDGKLQYKYFDDIDSKYCKSDKTYLLVLQFRKSFYDFIYKSRRRALTQEMFDSILETSILEDLRLDEIKNKYHTQRISILQKMNIWFSLSEKFNLSNTNKYTTMASNLQKHREFIKQLAKGKKHIESDEEYAFTAGQVIYYLLWKSKSADSSYKRLEPFMQQVHSKELNKAISRMFDSYKHENFSVNFRTPFAEVMDYNAESNVRDLIPTILAGIFSQNELFSDKEQKEVTEITSETEE